MSFKMSEYFARYEPFEGTRPGVPVPSVLVVEEHELYHYWTETWAWDKRFYQSGRLPAFRVPGTTNHKVSPREVTVFEQITPLR